MKRSARASAVGAVFAPVLLFVLMGVGLMLGAVPGPAWPDHGLLSLRGPAAEPGQKP